MTEQKEQTNEQMQIKYAPALQQPQEIIFNFEELETQIIANREKYMNLVVSEDAIKEAKDTKAKLNKLKIMLDDERKSKKKWCLEPYNKVEPLYNRLCNLVDEPIKAIDSQIKNFETKEKQKKLAEIEEFYKANVGPLEALVKFSSICKPEWENKTVSMKKIETEMLDQFSKINADLTAIDLLKSEFETEVKSFYLTTFDLSAAMQNNQTLVEQKQALEARAKAVEEEKELDKAADELAETMAQEKETITETLQVVEPIQEKVYTQTFTVVDVTKTQLIALSDFMNKNNIKFVVSPKQEAAMVG